MFHIQIPFGINFACVNIIISKEVMKKLFLLSFLFLSLHRFSLAQNKTLTCLIPRNDYSTFYVVNAANQDSILLTTSNGLRGSIVLAGLHYEVIYGQGRKRDRFGEREKHKKYLIRSKQDTLLTIRNNNTLIQFGNSEFITRENSHDGWKYTNEEGKTLCKLNLLWNKTKWNYTIHYFEENEKTRVLNKLIMSSLVEMAYYKSDCDCEDDDDDDFWLTLCLIN